MVSNEEYGAQPVGLHCTQILEIVLLQVMQSEIWEVVICASRITASKAIQILIGLL